MSTDDYVIKNGTQTNGIEKPIDLLTGGVAVKSGSRRTSISSLQSVNSDTQISLNSSQNNFDSGNFSYSITSDLSLRPNSFSEDEQGHDSLANLLTGELPDNVRQISRDLRQKDQSLLIAINENKKLKSQNERLLKSEQWYKNELKVQKRTKLELLEKLYLNKREYVQENQKLKADRSRLYGLCEEIERKTLSEKDNLVKQLYELQKLFQSTKFDEETQNSTKTNPENIEFNLQKQKSITEEYENLIQLLRKQKQTLLDDLSNLNTEKDAKIASLENNSFILDHENRKITKKCVSLVQEKKKIEETLKQNEKILEEFKTLLKIKDNELKQQNDLIKTQLKDLQVRDDEINRLNSIILSLRQDNTIESSFINSQTTTAHTSRLQQYFLNSNSLNFQPDLLPRENNDNNLIQNYKIELNHKDIEIQTLKSLNIEQENRIFEYQSNEIHLKNLLQNYDANNRLVKEYRKDIDEKLIEIENLKSLNQSQTENIEKLQSKFLSYKNFESNFVSLKENFEKTQIQLSNKICELENLQLLQNTQNNEIKRLQNEVSELKQVKYELVNCRSKLENCNTELDTRNYELIELKSKFENDNDTNLILRAELLEYQKLRENFDKYVNLLQQNNEELQLNNSELDYFKSLSDTQISEITRLESDNLDLQTKINDYENRQIEFDNLKESFQNQVQRISELNDDKIKTQKIIDQMLENHNEELEKLITINLQIKNQEKQNRIQQENFEKQLLLKNQEIDKFTDRLTDFNNDIIKLRTEVNNLEIQNEEIVRKNYELRTNLDEKTCTINDFIEKDNENRELKIKIERLNIEIGDLKKELKEIQSNSSEIALKISTNDQLDEISQNSNYCETIDNLKKLVIDQNNQIIKLNEQYENLRSKKVFPKYRNLQRIENRKSFQISKTPSIQIVSLLPSNDFIDPIKIRFYTKLDEKTKQNSSLMKFFNNSTTFQSIQNNENNIKILVNLQNQIELQLLEIERLKNDLRNYQDLLKNYENEKYESDMKINQFRESPLSDCNKCDLIKQEKEVLLCKLNQLRETSRNVPETCDNECQVENDNDDFKTMINVLKIENQKKIQRYEIYIRTLLNNVKTYKKNFEILLKKNQKNSNLIVLNSDIKLTETSLPSSDLKNINIFHEHNLNSHNLKLSKIELLKIHEIKPITIDSKENIRKNNYLKNSGKLNELNIKLEDTKHSVKILKQKLELTQQQLTEKDTYKCLSSQLQKNLENLLERHKKVFQPLENYQPIQTNVIYDLIDKSNKFVPTLNNLSSSLEGLRDDMSLLRNSTTASGNRKSSGQKHLSLLDELKAVDACGFK